MIGVLERPEMPDRSTVKIVDQGDHVLVRIERPPHNGGPRYEMFELSFDEANQLQDALRKHYKGR